MIRACGDGDLDVMLTIINLAAQAYKDVIPADRWHEPYMPASELAHEIADGVVFWCHELSGQMVGIAGLQDRGDVELIRHAYVSPSHQRQGIGGALLRHLAANTTKPILIGTWAASHWAISFYQKHGFRLVTPQATGILLRRYWSIPERQVTTSVVLGDTRWFERQWSEPAQR